MDGVGPEDLEALEREAGPGRGERRLGRREFLIAGASTGLALAAPFNHAAIARNRRRPLARDGRFAYGVSSGYPSPRAITLWTRVGELERSSRLTLEVAADRHFRHVVERRRVVARKSRDFTVHTRVAGLKPGREYHYRFETRNRHSRVGRFRTLPPHDSGQPVRIGYFSCQDYEAGFYNAQACLARERDLDLIVCLGDYIYEHHYYDGPPSRVDRTGANRDGDVQTLAEYRQKYRLYQRDPDLQDMHAAYPMVSVWDDHEVEDNWAGHGPDSIQPDPELENSGYPRRVPFRQRRRNGMRAFFEAMPRMRHGGNRNRVYGSIRLGGLAELFLTDERAYRDPQPCGDALLEPCPEDEQPGRTFLGRAQKRWFKRAVPASRARWKIWGSGEMVMSMDLPAGVHANPDQWDGYSAEREEVLGHFLEAGVRDLAVISGDIHTFFAGRLTTTGGIDGEPAGVELGGGSATSLGIPHSLGISPGALSELAAEYDPHIRFADFTHRGYGVVTARRDELIGELKAVGTTRKRHSRSFPIARFRVEPGRPELVPI